MLRTDVATSALNVPYTIQARYQKGVGEYRNEVISAK
jgi:hypothetical protein